MDKIEKYVPSEGTVLSGEMEDACLELEKNGIKQIVPIMGIFTVDQKYYVVLYVENDDKTDGECVIFRVESNSEVESLQVIEDKKEWDLVTKAWTDIVDNSNLKTEGTE